MREIQLVEKCLCRLVLVVYLRYHTPAQLGWGNAPKVGLPNTKKEKRKTEAVHFAGGVEEGRVKAILLIYKDRFPGHGKRDGGSGVKEGAFLLYMDAPWLARKFAVDQSAMYSPACSTP